MTHVVTQPCCSDGSCVFACPVNCIHPTPDDPAFALAEMLHIDPRACVDCGACVAACPVEAIKPHQKLTAGEEPFLAINAEYFEQRRPRPLLAPVPAPLAVRTRSEALRVAIAGSGPAGMYAADEILTIPGASVSMFERLPVPYGLARYGVAPDHRRTRRVARQFDVIRAQPGLTLHLGVEVGRDVSHEQLLRNHHAVIHAVGAAADRRLEIPGNDLPGVASATELVGWYNGHPDFAALEFDLFHPRVVVIGNGNVALDVARILTTDPERLAGTDIAPRALAALRASRVEEVVVVGRRGPAESAFTVPELVGLSAHGDADLVVDAAQLADAPVGDRRIEILRGAAPRGARRRVVLRHRLSAAEFRGGERIEGVEFVAPDGGREVVAAGLVLTSIGCRARPIAGLPFEEATATVPNERGRVVGSDTGAVVPGAFVAGWIKRGPTGFIGTNRSCARETVRALVEDYNAGRLGVPARGGGRRARIRPRASRERAVLAG